MCNQVWCKWNKNGSQCIKSIESNNNCGIEQNKKLESRGDE